jgi:hypothetical protein
MEEQEIVKAPEKTWEYKDRNYYLLGEKQPLTYTLPCKHSRRYPLVWFDPDLGYERELRYATNQQSIFVDEQEGSATLKHIVFEKGHLFVPKEKRNLQEFLEHHPHKNLIFKEFKREVVASNEVDLIELEVEALNIAMQLDVEEMEAVLRVEVGSDVTKMSSKELKRDLLRFTKRNPALFLDLVNDENIMLRNFGIRACEARIIKLSQDQRTFTWASNGRKLMNVPFEENPYSALAAWFQTDEGLEVYASIEKKLK